MDYRNGQELQSLNPRDYKVVICVAGTRYWSDKKKFHQELIAYLEHFEGPVLFVSGAATTGADDFIISWCKRYRFPCREEPADWDGPYKKAAGFKRNKKMAKMSTHLLAFYDGKSRGTTDMLEQAALNHLAIRVISIGDIAATEVPVHFSIPKHEEEPAEEDFI